MFNLFISQHYYLNIYTYLYSEDDIDGSLNLIITELKERIYKGEGRLIGLIFSCTLILSFYPLSTIFWIVSKAIIDVETITSIVADLSASEEDIVNESIQVLFTRNFICFCSESVNFF